LFEQVCNVNIDDKAEEKQMLTGRHIIKSIRCSGCLTIIGWTYIHACAQDQKYKVGKFIIERAYLVEEDNAEVSLPKCINSCQDCFTRINYFHLKQK
jgi:hypothetical protein